MVKLARPAYGSDFTAFAEDEALCKEAGTRSIGEAAGPSAARRYDFAYGQCMAAKSRMRQSGGYPPGGPPEGPGVAGNPDPTEYPHAFYGIPYATPGYGYDGFSY